MSASTGDAPTARSAQTWLVTRPLWQVGLAALVVAAVVAELFGLAARGIDVPMEASPTGGDEAESIPVGGLVMATFFYGVPGVLVALGLGRWVSRPARVWVVVAVVATLLSLLAPITVKDTETATKVVLLLSHLLVAAVMIPTLALRLAHIESDRETSEPETDTEPAEAVEPSI